MTIMRPTFEHKIDVIEIIDPELAMCLESRGFPYLYVRQEKGLEIIAFEVVDGFSEAFAELDEDMGCSIVGYYEAVGEMRIRDDAICSQP